ncbi:hypothetical protein [Microbispora sp. GKU 823]|uniref:hypothetical protein n=1 Tax=Microbispora sp. GKU 823 TaxID=1652100 RepID=UPI0009A26BDA|nr:hypothetical protein [Microbispora sp. GKU 823]OPG13681.1 hypothetical protein B1L11_06755 [Microbispora sp. GKU 823]
MIRSFLTRWARRHAEDLHEPLNVPDWPETDEPATPYIAEADPRDAELKEARRQLAEAQTRAADLEDALNRCKQERGHLAEELEKTRARLAAAHLAQRADADSGRQYVERSVEAPPPPTSDRAEALRERARADALAARLAAVEAELHAIRYPRVRPAKATATQAAS